MFESMILTILLWAAAAFIGVIGLGVLYVLLLYIADVTQTKQTIRRNFPVIGRFRYSFEHMGEFCDFVEFCYKEHDDMDVLDIHSENEELLYYIWKRLRIIIIYNGLHDDMVRGATFNHIVDFSIEYMWLN